MKKILGLTIAALLVMALVGGGTWAYFSDPETSTGNTITAGTLNLTSVVSGSFSGDAGNYTTTAGSDGVNGNVVFGDNVGVEPGESGSITWTLTESGSLGGTLTISSTLTSDENSLGEPEYNATLPGADTGTDSDGTDMDGELHTYVGATLTRDGTVIYGGLTDTDYYALAGVPAVLNAESRPMSGGATIVYVLKWNIATDVMTAGVDLEFGTGDDVDVDDNILQSDDAILDITFTLTQS